MDTNSLSRSQTQPADDTECGIGLGLALASANRELLIQLRTLLAALPASEMTNAALDPAFGATVGKHVRHTLDHVHALANAVSTGHAPYEARVRGSAVEHDIGAAMASLDEGLRFLTTLEGGKCSMRVTIDQAVLRDAPSGMMASTVQRELGFLYSHTIHHFAIIRMMLAGSPAKSCLPATFGLAPGTPVPCGCHDACAR